ncbi:MAG TPA: helix-turn-helix domain-containing protein [Hyphomicrobiaceae bacterium]|nr:helix-turn-helix domain-containing protein [Hyphomicrobiaceae bacterium]
MHVDSNQSSAAVAAVYSALAQETRLEAYRLLLRYQPFGLSAGDIARLLAVPHNTLSTHMGLLVAVGLVRARKDGRAMIYAAVPERLTRAQSYLDEARVVRPRRLQTAKGASIFPVRRTEDDVSGKIYNVLVLCTGNSARSILAEAVINREGQGRFRAYSAGSHPKGEPNPVGIELLRSLGYDVSAFRSKSWSEFAEPGAPKMDFIITVCDSAAGETCPYWPGHPLVAHWGIPDPAEASGSPAARRAAFQEAYRRLTTRITAFVNLPIDSLSLPELKARLAEIGAMEGATEMARAGGTA